MTGSVASFPLPPGGVILPVDKPEGPTSHDIVARARKALNTRKIGHTGTLDPFASGLLLLCVGDATRLSQYLTGRDKEYEATALLGVSTDSHDRDGTVTGTSEAWREVTPEQVEAALAGLRGEIEQVPPALSAKKVRGESAHRRVRRGETVELAPVPVTVSALELTGFDAPEVRLRVRCSSGTYIRALARDLGRALGTGAHLTALRRTAVGPHRVEGAVPGALDEPVDPGACLTPLEALEDLPVRRLSGEEARLLVQGRRIPLGVVEGREIPTVAGAVVAGGDDGAADGETEVQGRGDPGSGSLVAADWTGRLLALVRPAGDELQPVKVFPGVLEAPVP